MPLLQLLVQLCVSGSRWPSQLWKLSLSSSTDWRRVAEPLGTILDIDENPDSFESWVGERIVSTAAENSLFTSDHIRALTDSDEENSTFDYSLEADRTVDSILIEKSTFSGFLVRLDFNNNPYVPLPDIPEPVPAAPLPHNFTDRGNLATENFQFFMPPASGTPIITLGTPEFGDSESFKNIKEQKYSRGNTLILFSFTSWGNESIYDYGFNNLNGYDRHNLLVFLRWTLGYRIKIKDHFNIYRIGFILTPESEIAQPSRKEYAFNFRFQEG